MSSKSRPAAVSEDDPYAHLGGGSTNSALQYTSVDTGVLAGAIEAVTRRGDGVVFSRTSDGGALSVRVLHDSLVTKWYAKDIDELNALLGELQGVS